MRERDRLRDTPATSGSVTVNTVLIHSGMRLTRRALNEMVGASSAAFSIHAAVVSRGNSSFSVEASFTDEDAANSFVGANADQCHVQLQQGGGGSTLDFFL